MSDGALSTFVQRRHESTPQYSLSHSGPIRHPASCISSSEREQSSQEGVGIILALYAMVHGNRFLIDQRYPTFSADQAVQFTSIQFSSLQFIFIYSCLVLVCIQQGVGLKGTFDY